MIIFNIYQTQNQRHYHNENVKTRIKIGTHNIKIKKRSNTINIYTKPENK